MIHNMHRVFQSVPPLVSIKGVLTDGAWTLFWRYKNDKQRDLYRMVFR